MSRRQDRITDEAANWLVRAQDSGFSMADRKEFASWLAGSAEHVEEYLSLVAIAGEISEVIKDFDIDELVALARSESFGADVVALPGSDRSVPGVEAIESNLETVDRGARRRPLMWAIAATVLISVSVSMLQFLSPAAGLYETGVGEQISFPLEDGSVVSLNAQSTLRVEFNDERREVWLVSGEAMFDVSKDPDRPFRVVTERAVVEAVGTQFNVRYRGADMTVTVVEGLVDVQSTAGTLPSSNAAGSALPSSALLGVGQQARVTSGEVTVFETDVQEATSWRERRLVFEARPLSEVVAEFNLYNDHRIVISDPELASRAISGTFGADNRESFALFLSEVGLADYERRSDGAIVLRSAQASD